LDTTATVWFSCSVELRPATAAQRGITNPHTAKTHRQRNAAALGRETGIWMATTRRVWDTLQHRHSVAPQHDDIFTVSEHPVTAPARRSVV
jgi:hypothetical protein